MKSGGDLLEQHKEAGSRRQEAGQKIKKINIKKMAGIIVETKLGRGQTKNGDNQVNGKVIVYLDNGKKILCSPQNIKPIGFLD